MQITVNTGGETFEDTAEWTFRVWRKVNTWKKGTSQGKFFIFLTLIWGQSMTGTWPKTYILCGLKNQKTELGTTKSIKWVKIQERRKPENEPKVCVNILPKFLAESWTIYEQDKLRATQLKVRELTWELNWYQKDQLYSELGITGIQVNCLLK